MIAREEPAWAIPSEFGQESLARSQIEVLLVSSRTMRISILHALAPLALASLFGACSSELMQENRQVTNVEQPSPIRVSESISTATELDLAAPSKFETATFALG